MDTPTLEEVFTAALDARAAQIRTAMPAEIVTVNATTVDVRPTVWPGGEAAPILPSVPIAWPRAGTAYLVLPIEHGDTGLLLCCEADLAEWRRTGEAGTPADEARHHLQNAVFLPGLGTAATDIAIPQGATAGRTVIRGRPTLCLNSVTATEPVVLGTSFNADMQIWLGAVQTFCTAAAAAVPALAPACGALSAAAGVLMGNLPGDMSTSVVVAP